MPSTIDPGRFNQFLTFLSQIITADSTGEAATYAATNPPLTAWGEVKHVKATDKLAAGQDVAQDLVTITTWWDARIASTMRVQSPTGSVYIVQAIENVNDENVYLILTCLGLGANPR